MKINYFFPVFENDKFKEVYNEFINSKFFINNKQNSKLVICCFKNDKENLNFLKNISKNNKNIKTIIFDKKFTYNDAFENCIEYFDGEVVLLGDAKIARIDAVFEKCLEKKEKGADVVHVVKKRKGIKNFFYGILKSVYNFFIKIFTNKKDRLNTISLGLIDKDVLDVLKVLPRKRCFLKNTKDLLGFETRSVYVDCKTKTYKVNYKTKTLSFNVAMTSFICFFAVLFLTTLLNIFISVPVWINIVLIILSFACFILFVLFFPKHVFDLRNYPTKNANFKIKSIN